MAARFSSAPKTSVLSSKLIQRGHVPRFFVQEGGVALAADLRRLALALPNTVEHPHLNRAAFKVDRIYMTLAKDEESANFKFTPAEQEFKCQLAPHVFQPIDNGWGRQGWTSCHLAAATEADLAAALLMAYEHARGKSAPRL